MAATALGCWPVITREGDPQFAVGEIVEAGEGLARQWRWVTWILNEHCRNGRVARPIRLAPAAQ